MITITIHNFQSPGLYIGRGSFFGNPFKIGGHGDREQVIGLYRQNEMPRIEQSPHFAELKTRHEMGEHIALRCHCAPLHCHGDVIAEKIREVTDTKIIRVIVAGSRWFDDYRMMCDVMDDFVSSHRSEQIEIVSGRAKGADQLGERYAADRSIVCRHFPADWKRYGMAAGPIRNGWMADFASRERGYLVAFWTGSRVKSGTYDMMCQAQKKGIEVIPVQIGDISQNELF